MKRIIKGLLLFIFVIFSLFVNSIDSYAATLETPYVNINDTQRLDVGDLTFTNISFKDNLSTSSLNFGLTGIVTNKTSSIVNYAVIVNYYDVNYNLIMQNTSSGIATVGDSTFNLMTDLSGLKGYNISDIHYYRLTIRSLEKTTVREDSLTPSKIDRYKTYEYVIDKYDVAIKVNENNTLDITELITAYFNVPKHGIYRSIPLKNTITRLDGTSSKKRAKVSNLSVNNLYSTSRENGNYKIKIGSQNNTLIGSQVYVIKYTYNLGEDPVKNYDELYYNIIGNEWDTVIGNISFTITMPKEFDSSKLGFSSGDFGSVDSSKVKYNINNNKIIGKYDGILGVGQALTVRCELPEGYFKNASFGDNSYSSLMFVIPIFGLLVAFFLWFKFGRNDKVVETVEFYPPEELNSLEVGFLYKGKAQNKDVTSLLVYLANKGYLEIVNNKIDINSDKVKLNENSKNNANQKVIQLQEKLDEEKRINPNSEKIKYYENLLDIYKNIDTPINYEEYGLKSIINKSNKNNKFVIRKLKEYDGMNICEQLFMDGLFMYERVEVTDSMLYNKFYKTNNMILKHINSKENEEKIFLKSNFWKAIIIVLLMIISFVTMIVIPTLDYAGNEELFYTLGICLFYVPFFAVGIFTIMPLIFRIFWLGFIIVHFSIFFSTLPISEALMNETNYLICFIIGVLCLIVMAVFLKLMPKRTKYGNLMLGKIKGFKNFLETAEKDKLEAMVMENPNYFYDILPFTYVLGVSDKWIKKFETISMQSPNWYDSSSTFDVVVFSSFINSTMREAESVMASSPSSSSGGSSSGGSSGGGSSGGGSGGGGGGSW